MGALTWSVWLQNIKFRTVGGEKWGNTHVFENSYQEKGLLLPDTLRNTLKQRF